MSETGDKFLVRGVPGKKPDQGGTVLQHPKRASMERNENGGTPLAKTDCVTLMQALTDAEVRGA